MKEDLELKIEKYLEGAMTPEETLVFENEMDINEALKNEVLLTEDLNLFLKNRSDNTIVIEDVPSQEEKETREHIAKIHNTYKNHTEASLKIKKKKNNSTVISLFVGVAAVFIIFVGFYFSSVNTTSSSELYASYYEDNDLPSFTTRSSDGDLLSNATTNYREGNIDKGLSQFENYINTTANVDPLAYIYTGMIYAEKDQLEEAISQLEVLENSNSIDAERAYWFKAMVYLKFDDKKNAIKNLKVLQSTHSNYKKTQVNDLLEEL